MSNPDATNATPALRRRYFGSSLALLLGFCPWAAHAAAPGGEELWRFYADYAVTLVVPIPDLSGNGGMDVLVGSQDDTLYLVEGRGSGKGAPLWAVPFRATLMSAAVLGDVNGDGRPDAAAGDELGFMQAVSGGDGKPIWKFLTFGAVLSTLAVPDVDGDKVPDVVFGSENDTVYCMKGKASSGLGEVIWRFGAPVKKKGGGPPLKKATAPPVTSPVGINDLALLRKAQDAYGIVAGVSNDTVYCLPTAGGAPLWKVGIPGDAWKVAAFPDVDGDGIEDVLVACGADIAYLLKGSDGAVLWSHAVSLGAVSVAVSPDMTGDGVPDALIGDGGGKVHCVPGNASGPGAAAAWVFDFRDTSTIHSLAPLGDLDGDGRAECAAGTSHDVVAVLTGQGAKAWSVNMGGTVLSVANLGDLDGNGTNDVVAGTKASFAAAYQGHGAVASRLRARLRDASAVPWTRRVRLASGSGVTWGYRDPRGRRLPALLPDWPVR